MKKFFALFLALTMLGVGCSANESQPITSANPPVVKGVNLDLSGRGLTEIPASVFSQTNLETLNLSNNALTNAPQSQIGQLKNLKSLDLSENALTGLPAELGQLKNLETLNVSNNRLTGLPMELGNLTQLKVLDVTGNAYSARDLDEIAGKLTQTEIKR